MAIWRASSFVGKILWCVWFAAGYVCLFEVSIWSLSQPPIFLLIIETPNGFELSYIILFEFFMIVSVLFDILTDQFFKSIQIKLPDEGTYVGMTKIFEKAVWYQFGNVVENKRSAIISPFGSWFFVLILKKFLPTESCANWEWISRPYSFDVYFTLLKFYNYYSTTAYIILFKAI
jgi:hypothetical protein